MKTLLLSVLMLAATGASARQHRKLDGPWQIHNSIMGNDSNRTCTFTQKENELTATCEDSKTLAGKIDGDKVTWQLKTEYNGSLLTLSYAGHFDSDGKITGTVSLTFAVRPAGPVIFASKQAQAFLFQ